VTPITIVRVGLDRLDELIQFWLRLHRHQGSVADPVEGVDLLSDEASGAIVRDMYREWLSGADISMSSRKCAVAASAGC
jgi:hypothetical protein